MRENKRDTEMGGKEEQKMQSWRWRMKEEREKEERI